VRPLVGCISRRIYGIAAQSTRLSLHPFEQKSAHSPKETSTLDSELVLRDIPGKFRERRRNLQRFRSAFVGVSRLKSPSTEVVGITRTPGGLLLPTPRCLAGESFTGALPAANPGIGSEPPPADAAGSLRPWRHGPLFDHTSVYSVVCIRACLLAEGPPPSPPR